jgi:hypothetical protein
LTETRENEDADFIRSFGRSVWDGPIAAPDPGHRLVIVSRFQRRVQFWFQPDRRHNLP